MSGTNTRPTVLDGFVGDGELSKVVSNHLGLKKKEKLNNVLAQCLKITQKVAFTIASEASYVYILSGQKFLKNGKNVFFLKSLIWWSNSVTRPVIFNRPKIGEK